MLTKMKNASRKKKNIPEKKLTGVSELLGENIRTSI